MKCRCGMEADAWKRMCMMCFCQFECLDCLGALVAWAVPLCLPIVLPIMHFSFYQLCLMFPILTFFLF